MRRASQRRAAQAKESGKALQKDGVVSVTLVEGKKLIAMDDNGRLFQVWPIFCKKRYNGIIKYTRLSETLVKTYKYTKIP